MKTSGSGQKTPVVGLTELAALSERTHERSLPRCAVTVVQRSSSQADAGTRAALRWGVSARRADLPRPAGRGGNPWCGALWGPGGLPGRSRELGARGRPWHGCRLPLARDSLARGGGGGLPGSRDEEAQPGRPGSSLVTRASVACKQSPEDNGKRGTGRCLAPACWPGSKPWAASRTKAVGKQEVGGTLGWPEPSLAPAAILEEGLRFLQGAFPIPESG